MAYALQKQYDKWMRSVMRVPNSAVVPLVTAYMGLYRHRRDEALRKLNRINKSNYKMRRFREWERGKIPIPGSVRIHMQQVVIKARFGAVGEELLQLMDLQARDSDLL